MAEELKVYLDHLIRRDDLLYNRSEKKPVDPPETSMLSLERLMSSDFPRQYLRKPDFQRATLAWTPRECVELLESIVQEQVVPSIIMWISPQQTQYVLDGGHRLSVVLGWLNNDWGDKLISEDYRDEKLERDSKQAAKEVRKLLKQKKIGLFTDYVDAQQEYDRIESEDRDPESEMDSIMYKRALFYRRIKAGGIGFAIQWVKGDYSKAEESFLKINKSGRKLTYWETTLVENRRSSFARTVMSIANIASVKHCWTTTGADKAEKPQTKQKIDKIIEGVGVLHEMLFQPPYQTPVKHLRQPLLATPYTQPEMKPYYLAELLTIIQGYKGQAADTQKLLDKDRNASSEEIITNGLKYVEDALEVFNHIVGSSPKSLSLVPALYFYNSNGTFVRSLLYGFIYWLASGSDSDILNRKRVFSAHRESFEQIILNNKEDIIKRIGRRIGSGTEVTGQTATYFDGLLELLLRYNSDIESNKFRSDHKELIDKLKVPEKRAEALQIAGGESRAFTEKQKSNAILKAYFTSPIRCGICEGILDPAQDVQHDHILEWYKGGRSTGDNQRLVHPFCNNQANREAIVGLKSGKQIIELPTFVDPELKTRPQQLNFQFIFDEEFEKSFPDL